MGPGSVLHAINSALVALVTPFANALDLPHLRTNFPLLAWSALAFTAIHVGVAPALSKWVAPVSYGKLKGQRARNNWNIHIVSMVNAITVVVLAARALKQPALAEDKVYGWHETAEVANAVAAGYFLWDTIDAIVNFIDLGFVLHGLACTITYSLTFRPFLQYFSPRFLLWELSTPFLNIHWFLDKTGRTGSTFQLINGALLLSTFFFVRIVYGWYTNIYFWRTMWQVRHEVSLPWWLVFMTGHAVLNLLNLIWLTKMIRALRKRFDSDDKQPLITPVGGPADRPGQPPPHNYSIADSNPVQGAQ